MWGKNILQLDTTSRTKAITSHIYYIENLEIEVNKAVLTNLWLTTRSYMRVVLLVFLHCAFISIFGLRIFFLLGFDCYSASRLYCGSKLRGR